MLILIMYHGTVHHAIAQTIRLYHMTRVKAIHPIPPLYNPAVMLSTPPSTHEVARSAVQPPHHLRKKHKAPIVSTLNMKIWRELEHLSWISSPSEKVNELDILIESTKPDVILGTETWLNYSDISSDFFPSTFTVYRRDRGTYNHGGVLIAARINLISTMIHKGNSESASVKIELPNKRSMVVTSFYRPPCSNEDYLNSFIEKITTIRRSHETSYFYVGGDFNLPDVDWNTTLISGTSYPTKLNEAIIPMSDNLNLQQMVAFKTIGDNTLNLLFTTHPSFLER